MPLTPTATRELLAQLGHQPKRFLGQNFLVDGNIVRKSLELAGIRSGETVVEIGPGLGTLTTALLEAGAVVWAVEKDRTLHEHLSETLVPRYPTTLHLLEGDAVEHPLAGLSEREATGGFKVVANLPYAIATPWLDGVLSGPLPERMVLMLQQEAAQRYTAKPGSKTFGAISVFLQAAFTVAPGHKVEPSCFFPRPDIDSYLLHLVRKPEPFIFSSPTRALIRACFQQRRKQIGGLLRGLLPDQGSAWLAYLHSVGIPPQTRPEGIPTEHWKALQSQMRDST
jgi:16S rRNA (adenine1518-N6/adenine1519-N6)-dimethyltransferase